MVCPQCGAEFVSGIERCADCEIPLVDASAEPTAPSPSDDESLTAMMLEATADLAVGASPWVAAGEVVLRSALESFPTGAADETAWALALETGDPALLAAAESLLMEAAVPYRKSNEGLQDLFALGRIGMGFNPLVGPVKLAVPANRLGEVDELLAALDEYAGLDEDTLPSR